MSDILKKFESELSIVASDESHQDWDKLEYREIYYAAFMDGGRYAFAEQQARIDALKSTLEKIHAIAGARDEGCAYAMDSDLCDIWNLADGALKERTK